MIKLELSDRDCGLLDIALRAGIGDDAIDNCGFSTKERKRVAKLANDISEAAGRGRPYYER